MNLVATVARANVFALISVLLVYGDSVRGAVIARSDSSVQDREPMVIDAYRLEYENDKGEDRSSAGIGDIIVVKVRHLQTLVNRARCLNDAGERKPECIEQKIVLCLDGRILTGHAPEAIDTRAESETLQFHLTRDEENDEAWADLLGNPPTGKKFFRRDTQLSVGLENGYIAASMIKDDKFKLIRVKSGRFWVGALGLLLLLVAIFYLAHRSDIFRDSGPEPASEGNGKTGRRPYSLARCQLAFWFFLVVSSFLFLWLITGAYDIITTSILALMGIGSGTALGAAIIDNSKKEQAHTQYNALHAEQATLNDGLATLETQERSLSNADTAQEARDMKKRLHQVSREIGTLASEVGPQKSHGFSNDLLSDATGVSFHRLQMFVWTIVLGIIFISSVWKRLAMPEFSATLLALQGLSAGTYLGFKMPEKMG